MSRDAYISFISRPCNKLNTCLASCCLLLFIPRIKKVFNGKKRGLKTTLAAMLAYRMLLKKHCEAILDGDVKSCCHHLFQVEGVDIAKEIDYLLKDNQQPPALLTSGTGRESAGAMFHGRNLFLVSPGHVWNAYLL